MVTFKCPHCGCTKVREITFMPHKILVDEFNRDGSPRTFNTTDAEAHVYDSDIEILPKDTPLAGKLSRFQCEGCEAMWDTPQALKEAKAIVETRHRQTKAYYEARKKEQANDK